MPPLLGYKVVYCWWLKVLSEGKKELLSVVEEKVVISCLSNAIPPHPNGEEEMGVARK